MSTSLRERPATASAGNGGVPARRAVIRWAWRLFRREWRQQLLVLALLAVAVAVTILGTAIAINTPPPLNPGFGTANHLLSIPGTDPHLAADIAAIKQRFGTIDVIENQSIATGTVNGAELQAQDPSGPYGRPMLSLVAGRYPTGRSEVALSSSAASTFNLRIGDLWHQDGRAWRIVGLVENPQSLLDAFALVAPGQVSAPTQVTILFDATHASVASFHFPSGANIEIPSSSPPNPNPAIVVLAIATLGLIFIGLVAVAGFTVMAQRRLRALGMLGALGATDRNIRLVLVANGAVVGIFATLIGAAVGFLAWIGYVPHLETSAGHRIDALKLPWWAIGTAMVLAIVTAIVAARRPAHAVARIPVVAALSGRPAAPKAVHRRALPGLILVAVGACILAFAGGWAGSPLMLLVGLVATTVGGLLLAPVCIAGLAVVGQHAPIAVRLALRDLVRYRARSGAALAAISFAILLTMLICIIATARYANALDLTGINLPSNQLVFYPPGNNPDSGPRPGGPGADAQKTPAEIQARENAVAASLGTHDVLALDAADATLSQAGTRANNFSGAVYVATPALLRHFGIKPSQIDPGTDFLTSRVGLAAEPRMQILYGNDLFDRGPGGPSPSVVDNPKIQTFSNLDAGTSDPNTVITMHALRTLKLQSSLGGWLIQTARPLTALQINDARQMAVGVGATIETKSSQPSLAQLRDWSTAAGLLLALGVLAMTVGLIRSETGSELRTLTATGAGSTTRRTITGATAGALALLGALLGTAIAYIVTIAWYRSSLGSTVGHVPVQALVAIIVGLPLIGTIGGWLFAGREPPVIARQPLE
jgi:putative ABC transport system permease protein